jgi:hypothetical protein
MALFDMFFNAGADELFNEGQSLRAVASYLRDNGFSFSDSSLRDFRDTINGDKTLDLSNFGENFEINPELFTVSELLPCGEYGIRVEFSGYNQSTGLPVNGHTFERVSSFTTSSDFISEVGDSIKERALDNSDIVIDNMAAHEGYIGAC